MWGGGILVENADASDLVIRNNICSQNELFQIAVELSGSNLTIITISLTGIRATLRMMALMLSQGIPCSSILPEGISV